MLTALLAALSAPEQDRVASLPGYGEPPSPQFSGYLDAGAAEPGTKLHYWFAAAETADWAKRPVVLWLNGGPGSSSLLGMLQEQGPLIIDRNGKLMRNPYAWTTLVNLVALESPAGVGFSYCAAMKAGGSCSNTDVSTARAAHAGLQDFFSAKKFPELAANDFYITGESYAGVYCPTLAAEIVSNPRGGQRIRLVGIRHVDKRGEPHGIQSARHVYNLIMLVVSPHVPSHGPREILKPDPQALWHMAPLLPPPLTAELLVRCTGHLRPMPIRRSFAELGPRKRLALPLSS